MYEVKVIDRWDLRQKWVYVFQRDPRGMFLLRIRHAPMETEMIHIPDGMIMDLDPTFALHDDWLDPLLEQLSGISLTHAEGLEEAYLHERGRVDKLIEYAMTAQVQIWDESQPRI